MILCISLAIFALLLLLWVFLGSTPPTIDNNHPSQFYAGKKEKKKK